MVPRGMQGWRSTDRRQRLGQEGQALLLGASKRRGLHTMKYVCPYLHIPGGRVDKLSRSWVALGSASCAPAWRSVTLTGVCQFGRPEGARSRKNDASESVCSRAPFLHRFSSFSESLGPLKTVIPIWRGVQNHVFDQERKNNKFGLILGRF